MQVMRNILLVVLGCISALDVCAQISIGTNSSETSAAFQIEATDKGFLAPRVTLTSATDVSTIPAPANGLLVYCTASGSLTDGYYYFNGSKWNAFNETTNNRDLGYVVGWGSNVGAPNFLLPLNGGTYLWSDYPEFQLLHAASPSQYISSSTASSFTLINIHTTSRFLRGSSSTGVLQAGSTAMPSNALGTTNAGSHLHAIDPPAEATTNTGTHLHNLSFNNDDYNNWGGGNQSLDDDAGPWYTRTTDWAGAHAHTLDIAAFNSATSGAHTHTLIGGDAETRPLNISVIWYIKVKSTSTAGQLTILNQANALTSSSNAITHSGSNQKLGGTLTTATVVNLNNNDLAFTNGELGIGTSAPANNLEINSGVTGQSGVRLTQMTNAANLGTTASGNLYIPEANVVTQLANAGVAVQLGNLKVQVSTAGNRSLQFATVSGTTAVIGTDEAVVGTGTAGSLQQGAINTNLGTTWLQFNTYSFPWQGNVQRTFLTDVTSGITYRVTMIIGNNYLNNLIRIEKLN